MNQVTDTLKSESGSGSSWESRISAAQQGSREAQAWLFAAVRAYLRAMANERLDPQLAVKASPSDLVQETLLEAYQHFERFAGRTRGELVLWLQGILNHRILTVQRAYRDTAKRNLNREISLSAAGSPDRRNSMPVDSGTPTPSVNAMAAEDHERLNRVLTRLPPPTNR